MSEAVPDAIEKVITKELKSIKYKSFGKITVNKSEKFKSKAVSTSNEVLQDGGLSLKSSLLSKQSEIFTSKVKSLKETRSE